MRIACRNAGRSPNKSDELTMGCFDGSVPTHRACHILTTAPQKLSIKVYSFTNHRQDACRAIIPNGSRGETQACAYFAIKECCETISARGGIFLKALRQLGLPRQVLISSHRVPPRRISRAAAIHLRTAASRSGVT